MAKKKVKRKAEVLKEAVSIRFDTSDLNKIKEEAERMGMPYQTLICSVIHRFVDGQLLDRKEVDLITNG